MSVQFDAVTRLGTPDLRPTEDFRLALVPLEEIRPHPENPRTITEADFAALMRSLEAAPHFLMDRSALVQARTGFVYAGNMRYRGMVRLAATGRYPNLYRCPDGRPGIPCRIRDISDAQAKADALRDNNLLGQNVDDEVALWLGEVREAGIPVTDLAFAEGVLERLLETTGGGEEPTAFGADDDTVPEPPAEPRTRPGEVWTLGRHRVLVGDARRAEDRDALMRGRVADLGLHDPPYGLHMLRRGLANGSQYANAAARKSTFTALEGDDEPFEPVHLLDTAGVLVLWGANHYADLLPPSAEWLVWDKRVDLPSNKFGDGELAWVSRPPGGGAGRLSILRHTWNGMIRASEHGEERLHPTQKPVAVLGDILERYSTPGALVADWYLGSGSTLVACERTGRTCFGLEIDPQYVDATLERFARATGSEPLRESDGAAWSVVRDG